ncbi:MAG: sensor histidine kinase [Ruminococcaceae bacterium]|nr:sensor histidine kinase [Oscillospiraceae bacterium]
MKELSLNILDIAENSVRAMAENITVALEEDDDILMLSVRDDGCGMSKELLEKATDPFTTSRTNRRVGFGIPFLKYAAERTGGYIVIGSSPGIGTEIKALFYKKHIDYAPLGDVISTVVTLIHGSPNIDIVFSHSIKGENKRRVYLSTKDMRSVLGSVRLDEPEVLSWVREYLLGQYGGEA